MTHESYKAWLDEMPIDDVRRRIERLEKKLWDLNVLERLYNERRGGGEESPAEEDQGEGGEPGAAAGAEGEPASEWHDQGAHEGDPGSEGGEHGEHEGEAPSEGGEEHAGG